MRIGEAITGLKSRLDIKIEVTDFDSQIEIFLRDAAKMLAPTVYKEVDVQEVDITVSRRGEAVIDLSTLDDPVDDVREVEASSGDGEWPLDAYSVHGTSMRIRELPSDANSLFIYGLRAHTLEELPEYLEIAVYYFAQSLFYTFLMANKAKYNVYMQNGRGAVDNMQDLVDFFEQKGQEYLENKATPYGR